MPPHNSATKHGKAFLSYCQLTFPSHLFSLHFIAKRCTENKVACDRVAQSMSQTDIARTICRCLKHLSLTNELNIVYEGYYYSHIDIYHFQIDIIRAGSFQLTYIRWLVQQSQNPASPLLQYYYFGWSESNNFVITALYFTFTFIKKIWALSEI